MDCKMCNADKSMTVVWLSTQARNPCNTNCHWSPIILPTPATLLPHVTSGWCHFPALHHPIRCSNKNVSFSHLTAQNVILSILPLLSYSQKV